MISVGHIMVSQMILNLSGDWDYGSNHGEQFYVVASFDLSISTAKKLKIDEPMRSWENVFVAGAPEVVSGIQVYLAFGAGSSKVYDGIYWQGRVWASVTSTHSSNSCLPPI